MKPFYISTAIAYTSAKPHIGNTYEVVLADAIARYKRLEGFDVYFQTGTDEHGLKIQQKAKDAALAPQQYVDDMSGQIKRIWDLMNTSYDRFIRTTDPEHVKKVQQIFRRLYDKGDIYKGKYKGKYCTPCESFWTESQLVDGKCPDCGRPVMDAEESAYFFRMSKYSDRLLEHIETHPEFIQPESRRNEMINNFLKPGLQDLCVSRSSFTWGIPVDFDAGHVVYVWLDALTNYITFCGYNPVGESDEHYKKYWPADIHLIGKDIVRFHTIYWPIFLMALEEPLPKKVFGHPWLLVNNGDSSSGEKMSKSLGNVVYADELVNLFGVDSVRYYVLHEMPFANDGILSYRMLIERTNSDLANILGNLVNRTISMELKYFGGKIMAPTACESVDEALKNVALAMPQKVAQKMENLQVADAIDEIFVLLRRANKYIDETAPWILAKDSEKTERLGTVLYNLLEVIRFAAIMLSAFLPETSEKILNQLRIENDGMESLTEFGGMMVGTKVGPAEILFDRIDTVKKLQEINERKAAENAGMSPTKTLKPIISFDDFENLDMTVVKVLECEKVQKSKKLLRFVLDDGSGIPRQILSGMAAYYKPEDLIGKTLVACTNLPTRRIMGLDSCGMLLSAEKGDQVELLILSNHIPAGASLC